MIIEADRKTHELMLNKGKRNVEWKKCPVFNRISVKRDVLNAEIIFTLQNIVLKIKHDTNIQENVKHLTDLEETMCLKFGHTT